MNQPVQFERGQTVYHEDGQQAQYVVRVDEGHVVRPAYEDDFGDEARFGDPTIWRNVFATPPKPLLDTEMANALAVLRELDEKAQARRTELRALDKDHAALKDRIKQHAQLRYIDDVLEGRITHALVKRQYYGPYVLRTLEELIAVDADGSNRKMIPLLVLAAKPGTYHEHHNHWWNKLLRMEWHTTTEGSFEDCWLFPSLELAKEAAAKMLLAEAASERKDSPKQVPLAALARIVDNMKALGLSVPDDLLGAWTLHQQRQAESALASQRKEHAKATDALAKAEAAARAAGVAFDDVTA